ncbi:MAG TPA: exosome complex RNA-binding protein Rrp4 [Thermoplasmata archaeon]|nr:exosome complex RNA-binding protein Rrp4 [Thermoplasmata archaeon]HEV2429590.1 exosome complex RNA-binding protein Rrp4 [Thermoplasmata archaeon]
MGSGHRPGHRGRGREGNPSPTDAERVLVLPGEEIAVQGLKPGPGTYRVHGKTYASVLGLVSRRPPLVRVVPLSGRYLPKPNDVVVGTVTDVQGTFWLLDIGAPRWAPLHMTGTPWKIDFGETEQYLHVADSVVVAVESLEATGRIGVTMNGEGLGKLEGGTIVPISPARVPRVIGRNGSMIGLITRHTGARIVVGQNGRVWVDGSPDAIRRVEWVLRKIDEEGQRSGLTEAIESYLVSTGAPGEDHPNGGRTASEGPDEAENAPEGDTRTPSLDQRPDD